MQSHRVLIVDDNPSLLLILSETFRFESFEVMTAEDGATAVEQVRTSPPDLLVLDVGLPGRNGFEVCRALKDDPRTAAVPIILLTARAADADRHWGLDAGADEYLTKPFDPDQLLRTARELLSTRHAGESRNPLTKLPDLESIGRRARAQRAAGAAHDVRALEFDARSAAILRQKYGEPAVAHAVRLAATCLREALARESAVRADRTAGAAAAPERPEMAIGHGGDASYSRFAVLAPAERADRIIARASELFAQRVGILYDATDLERRAVTCRRADGTFDCVPLVDLIEVEADAFERGDEMAA
ncbi:MAG: response regulator [Candidatus Eiseniibacteriota bacterium]|jgi:DNA-binding response OmpR family regulator